MTTLSGIGLARFAYTALMPQMVDARWFNPEQVAYLGAPNLLGYLFGALAAAPLAEPKAFFVNTADYARRHQEVIERFGRFPHRNAILGRASTAQEQDYLAQPGSGF